MSLTRTDFEQPPTTDKFLSPTTYLLTTGVYFLQPLYISPSISRWFLVISLMKKSYGKGNRLRK